MGFRIPNASHDPKMVLAFVQQLVTVRNLAPDQVRTSTENCRCLGVRNKLSYNLVSLPTEETAKEYGKHKFSPKGLKVHVSVM